MNVVRKLAVVVVCFGAFIAFSICSVFAGSESPYGSGGEVTFVGDTEDAVHSFTNVGANTFTLSRQTEVWFLVVGGGRGTVIIRVKRQLFHLRPVGFGNIDA